MATKKELLADPDSCLNKAADDEPVFVVRAQDLLAAATVRYWAQAVTQHAASSPASKEVEAARARKVEDAELVAQAMDVWPNKKLPD